MLDLLKDGFGFISVSYDNLQHQTKMMILNFLNCYIDELKLIGKKIYLLNIASRLKDRRRLRFAYAYFGV